MVGDKPGKQKHWFQGRVPWDDKIWVTLKGSQHIDVIVLEELERLIILIWPLTIVRMYLITVPQNMYRYMLTKERKAHSKSVVYIYTNKEALESTIENASTSSINEIHLFFFFFLEIKIQKETSKT